MKKFGFCLIIIVVLIIFGIFFPWNEFFQNLKTLIGIKNEGISSLKIYSLSGDIEVFIDGESKGIAKGYENYLEILPIESGEHEVKLKRISDNNYYIEYKKVVFFEKGFDTVMAYELGPTEESSSGWTVYAKKALVESDNIEANIVSSPEDIEIFLDDDVNKIKEKKMNISLNTQHIIKAKKEGYQTLDFTILPEKESERAKLRSYKLFIEIKLYKIPI